MENKPRRIGISVGALLLIVVIVIIAIIIGITIANMVAKSEKNVEINKKNETSEGIVEDDESKIAEIKTGTIQKQTQVVEGTNYVHTAIQGCEITVDNQETGEVTYKEKCEICGEVSNQIKQAKILDSDYTSAFYCPNCKQTQTVEIETQTNI